MDGLYLSRLVVAQVGQHWQGPTSAVRLGAIRVIVSFVLLISIASGRLVHTISRFVLAANGRAGAGEF